MRILILKHCVININFQTCVNKIIKENQNKIRKMLSLKSQLSPKAQVIATILYKLNFKYETYLTLAITKTTPSAVANAVDDCRRFHNIPQLSEKNNLIPNDRHGLSLYLYL